MSTFPTLSSDEEKKDFLIKGLKSKFIIVCIGQPSNLRRIKERILKAESDRLWCVAYQEKGYVTLKQTNGSANNLKKLLKSDKYIGIVYQ